MPKVSLAQIISRNASTCTVRVTGRSPTNSCRARRTPMQSTSTSVASRESHFAIALQSRSSYGLAIFSEQSGLRRTASQLQRIHCIGPASTECFHFKSVLDCFATGIVIENDIGIGGAASDPIDPFL